MLKKIIVMMLISAVCMIVINGCKENSTRDQSGTEEPAKTKADFKAEAEKEINNENMDKLLSEIEENVEQEAGQLE